MRPAFWQIQNDLIKLMRGIVISPEEYEELVTVLRSRVYHPAPAPRAKPSPEHREGI